MPPPPVSSPPGAMPCVCDSSCRMSAVSAPGTGIRPAFAGILKMFGFMCWFDPVRGCRGSGRDRGLARELDLEDLPEGSRGDDGAADDVVRRRGEDGATARV